LKAWTHKIIIKVGSDLINYRYLNMDKKIEGKISLAYYKFYVSFGGIAGLVILITITVNFISNY